MCREAVRSVSKAGSEKSFSSDGMNPRLAAAGHCHIFQATSVQSRSG